MYAYTNEILSYNPQKSSESTTPISDRRSSGELNVQFAPFDQSHLVEDVCLLLTSIGSVVVITAVSYGFLYPIPWDDARALYAVTVVLYVAANRFRHLCAGELCH